MQLQTALIVASFVIELSLASYPPLQFDFIRESQEVNDLELICRNATTISLDQIEDAKYFVNTTQVEQGLLSPSNHGHAAYRITRDREGNYSCGVHGSNSNGIVLLGKPHIDTVHRTVSIRCTCSYKPFMFTHTQHRPKWMIPSKLTIPRVLVKK